MPVFGERASPEPRSSSRGGCFCCLASLRLVPAFGPVRGNADPAVPGGPWGRDSALGQGGGLCALPQREDEGRNVKSASGKGAKAARSSRRREPYPFFRLACPDLPQGGRQASRTGRRSQKRPRLARVGTHLLSDLGAVADSLAGPAPCRLRRTAARFPRRPSRRAPLSPTGCKWQGRVSLQAEEAGRRGTSPPRGFAASSVATSFSGERRGPRGWRGAGSPWPHVPCALEGKSSLIGARGVWGCSSQQLASPD